MTSAGPAELVGGPRLPWRGTRVALERLLEVLTDGRVAVVDSGGGYAAGRAEPADRHVAVPVGAVADFGGGGRTVGLDTDG